NTIDMRVASITVTVSGLAPVVVTVTQDAGLPTLDVEPPNQDVTAAPGSTFFSVATNSPWTGTSDQTWCTVTASGTGNGNLTADYEENTFAATRIANITVTVPGLPPQTVTVTQAGAAPTLDVQPPEQVVNAPAGSTSFTVTSNADWTASSDMSWCTVTPSGSGNGTLYADFSQNSTGNPREAHVAVMVNGLPDDTVLVYQLFEVGVQDPPRSGILVYPNPTSGILTLEMLSKEWQGSDVSILDMTGRTVLSQNCTGKMKYVFDLTSYPEGTYFMKIMTGGGTRVVRLVIKK
ncbi:MAG TPA: BACON domain-containing carbohydrate-binding protein, partial [Bacteroidales bacterium]|nr:BACON domain-containing carbohydrate-binding protein [Bacteroidales bacterium]